MFADGGIFATLQQKTSVHPSITMPTESTTEQDKVITHHNVHTAERYLGIQVAPSGQLQTEFQYRLQQSKELSSRICTAHLSRIEATTAYHSRWLSVIGSIYQ